MSSAAPGPSRVHAVQALDAPAPPSTSGDSDSTAPPAERGLDTGVLKELARAALVEALNDVQGAKTLVLDPGLAGPLGLVTEVALLKHQAVDKMFWLEAGPLTAGTRNIVWLCRPKRAFMSVIAEQIRAHQADPPAAGPHTYTILLVPRATELCRKALEDEGVAGDVNIAEFKLELIPIDEDVLSLEMDNAARDIYLRGDDTPIFYASLALMTFQRAFGLIPRVLGKGDGAQKLVRLLEKHRAGGEPAYADMEMATQIDGMVVLDRSVDWVTPMCTQLTYEGMLDEFVGIKNAHIEVDAVLLDPPPAPGAAASSSSQPSASAGKKKKHHLSSADRVFADIRDLNFAVVGSRLSRVARRLEGDYGGVKNLKSVSQMKDFVGRLGGLQSEQQALRLHTSLTEQLMPITRTDAFNKTLEAQQNLVAGYDAAAQLATIDDLLCQQAPMPTVLRTAVLMSLTAGGIKPKPLEAFKRDFLQTYGYHHLALLLALQDLGLLARSPAPSPFPALRRALRLVVDDTDDAAPTDVSYVYSGYAPLSIRLVQCAAQKNAVLAPPPAAAERDAAQPQRDPAQRPRAHPLAGWKGFEDVLAGIPGATVDVRQRAGDAEAPAATTTTVVFFLGGCTYTEIAALRWMSRQTTGRRFLIATTGIINGTSLLESFGSRPPVALQT